MRVSAAACFVLLCLLAHAAEEGQQTGTLPLYERSRRARRARPHTGSAHSRMRAGRSRLDRLTDASQQQSWQQREHEQDHLDQVAKPVRHRRQSYPQSGQQQYGLEDLLVVIPSTHERLSLVEAGRSWRAGMQAYIILDKALDTSNVSKTLLDGREEFRETFGHYADMDARHIWSQPGDARAALAPFRANKTIGLDNYRWILYGDDDTVWFPENVLRLVNGLDHAMPYFLSDHLWFPEWKGRKDVFVHASRRAPRCLPCNYTDPLEETGVGWQINLFHASKACPCTLDALCKGAPNPHIINPWDCQFSKFRPAWWYFAHGGAGAVLSSSLMRRASYSEVENKIWNQHWFASGDSAFTDVIWDKMRVLPTDPGPGYFREHLRLFDPGWKGPQAKGGGQDTDTEDWGNDPPGLASRYELALSGRADQETLEQLDWVITSHIRSRYIGMDLDTGKLQQAVEASTLLQATPEALRPAAFVHLQLADLQNQYAAARRRQGTP